MNEFMKLALEEARIGIEQGDGGPFGAVIERDGAVISKAHNEVLKTNDPTAHAEILAIRRASSTLGRFDLWDCKIYCTSEPCPMCLSAIYWARLKCLYYGTTKEDVAAIGFDDDRIYKFIRGERDWDVKTTSINRDDCLEVLKEWSSKPDRRLY